jgi:uncharacterized protein YndB with AHSA1/START domain
MSVKKEASGRRSIQIELALPGTPEEVWQAIATGPGISAWLMPAEFEEREGTPVALKLTFGPGVEPRSAITSWDPPRMYATEADGWIPGSPPIASEWHVEAQAGGQCTLRIVQSLFASTDDWDHQLEAAETGLAAFLYTLQLYLTHFRGLRSTMMKWMVPVAGTEAEAWAMLTAALGIQGVAVAQRWTAPATVPALSGMVEYLSEAPYDLLLRVEQPAPAIAAFGAVNMGGPSMIGLNLYLYGDHVAETVARETPLWQAWFDQHFPLPREPDQGD